MDPEYQGQVQRLQQFRRSLAEQQMQNALNSQEGVKIQSGGSSGSSGSSGSWPNEMKDSTSQGHYGNEPLRDPLIYPGLYAPSGFDMMGILIRVRTRPNPIVNIGNIDSSVALVLCDLALPNSPIVYYSDPFAALTGYTGTEILGRNCRFLQHPHASIIHNVNGTEEVDAMNAKPRAELRDTIQRRQEAQVRLVNYTKGGVKFFNLLTVIPIAWDEGEVGKRYMVGFQAQDNSQFW